MKKKNVFRGKREDNGEWVKGNLLGEDVIIPENQEFEVEGCKIFGCDLTAYIVDPETVGRSTELTDKDGNEIFEGDVVRCYGGEYYSGYYEYDRKIVVNDIKDGTVDFLGLFEYLEVKGNIHDNPELLKKEENSKENEENDLPFEF